jgi:3-dehydroquinate synthase
MNTITLQGKLGKSTLQVGVPLEKAQEYIEDAPCFVITDRTVRQLYGHRFPENADIVEIGTGEPSKTLDTAVLIYERLMKAKADRSAFLFGIGGGIVCDITGFVGSTYLRGIRFGFAPTTLLAQVDASVGGKNGVNLKGFKNIIGVFNQPEFVICDPSVLPSLGRREIACGISEIIKNALIADAELFEYLERNAAKALAVQPDIIGHLVYHSVRIKAMIVSRDETESGERRILNFGHTLGHAIEKIGAIPHGEAVAMGMGLATELSVQKGFLTHSEADRISNLLTAYGLSHPVRIPSGELLSALDMDKKRIGAHLHFVLLKSIGKPLIHPLPLKDSDLVNVLQKTEPQISRTPYPMEQTAS